MASRVFNGLQVIGPNRVRISGLITFGVAGVPSVTSGFGFTVSRTSPGTLVLTFDDIYSDMEYVNMSFTSCNVSQLYMASVSKSDYTQNNSQLLFTVGAFSPTAYVPGDPSDGDELSVDFIMKNTGVTSL